MKTSLLILALLLGGCGTEPVVPVKPFDHFRKMTLKKDQMTWLIAMDKAARSLRHTTELAIANELSPTGSPPLGWKDTLAAELMSETLARVRMQKKYGISDEEIKAEYDRITNALGMRRVPATDE